MSLSRGLRHGSCRPTATARLVANISAARRRGIVTDTDTDTDTDVDKARKYCVDQLRFVPSMRDVLALRYVVLILMLGTATMTPISSGNPSLGALKMRMMR